MLINDINSLKYGLYIHNKLVDNFETLNVLLLLKLNNKISNKIFTKQRNLLGKPCEYTTIWKLKKCILVYRKNHQRAMESMQASLESEQRSKSEALRIKKKLEGDINELEIALDHSNKANNEAQKSIKRYQVHIFFSFELDLCVGML